MRFVGRGHDAVRATHTKTLELSPDADITARATCVVAVDARTEDDSRVAGPVRIDIAAGGESFTVHALGNSSWQPGQPAVIRRSALRLPGTLATHADASAADLPRTLVAALADPRRSVEVLVTPVAATAATLVLFAAEPAAAASARLWAEVTAADTVLAEDADARRLVGPQPARPEPGRPRRVLAIATRDLPGATVMADLETAVIETVGLPARLAVAAASPSRGPLVLAPDDADRRELLRSTPAAHRLVLRTETKKLAALLRLATEIRGEARIVVAQEYGPPLRIVDGRSPELPGSDLVHVCIGPAAGNRQLDPTMLATVTHLLADGVSTRTAAKAVSDLTGLSRREAYDLVLELARVT